MRRTIPLALLLGLVCAARLQAQPGRFADPPTLPAAPSDDLPVVAVLASTPCDAYVPVAVVRSGDTIDLRYPVPGGCVLPPPFPGERVELGVLPAGTYHLRAVGIGDRGDVVIEDTADVTVSPSPCDPDPTVPPGPPRLCLQHGRFQITVGWTDYAQRTGAGVPVPLSADTGSFWFFTPANQELMVKVLDACAVNGHYWLYAAGLTDVGVTITVDDLSRGAIAARWVRESPRGQPFQPLSDLRSFPCTCTDCSSER